MTDYVKRSDVINYVCQFCKDQHADELCDQWNICQLFTRISNVPSADVVERKHGKWIKEKYGGVDCLTCSACGMTRNYLNRFNFCPSCGAKMEE